ncbi:MAG: TIGR00270 family protein [Thermoplasmatales archaeon]|nr:TIGR00270 family protein [Thermoplasmatales archaeon]
MCGKDVPVTRPVFIERSKINVCAACAKFGEDAKAGGAPGSAPSAVAIEQRLERRRRRMGTRDAYAGTETVSLVEDYGRVVREARQKRGLDLDEFSDSIGERRGTISRIEANELVPDDKLRKKLERELDITLMETVQASGAVTAKSQGPMTLEDFIKRE